MKRILLVSIVLLTLALHGRTQGQLYQATFNPPEPVLALKYGTATLAELPIELKTCYWTAGNWSNPPTTQQVQQVAQLQIAGGANPQKLTGWGPQNEPDPVPKNCMVLLNCEGWSDAAIKDAVGRYRAAVGSGKLWTVYGMWFFGGSPGWVSNGQLIANQYMVTRSMEARRSQIKAVVDQMPAVLVEAYPFDPLDDWLRAWDFQAANLRRLYPGKKLVVITRGFKQTAGVDGGESYVTLSPAERIKLAAWLRSRADVVVIWGWRSMNLDFARELVKPVGWDAKLP